MKRPTRKTAAKAGPSPADTAASGPAPQDSPDPPPDAGARIGIQVEPAAPAAQLHGRHDFIVRGRVVSTARVADIVLLSGGGRLGQLTFGRAEAASPLALPDGSSAMQHNFVFQLASQHADDAARVDFTVAVRTDEEQGAQADFEIAFDPNEPALATVAAGPVVAGISAGGVVPAIILYAESATVDTDGNLRVGGWAVSREMLVGIQVSVDDDLVGPAALGGAREDVANVHQGNYPNARNSGFSLSAPIGGLADGARHVRIQAITLAGSSLATLMPLEQVERPDVVVPVPAPAPRSPPPAPSRQPPASAGPATPDPIPDARRDVSFYCDELTLGTDGILSVRGWAVCPVGIAAIGVMLDDKKLGDAELGLARLDVGDRFRDIQAARFAGFRLKVKALDSAQGMHVLRLAIRNGLDDVRHHQQRVDAQTIPRAVIPPRHAVAPSGLAAAPPAAPPKTFEFRLESPTLTAGTMTRLVTGRLTLEGWVLGRTGIAGIEVLLDGLPLGQAHYGLRRRDIATAFREWPGSLRCGFAFHCPSRALRDGDHVVSLRITANDGSTHAEQFRITVAKAAGRTDFAAIRQHVPPAEATLYADVLRRLDWQPWFRLVLRDADASAPDRLARTLISLEAQLYPYWRADLLGDDAELRRIVAALVSDGRLGAERVGFLGDSAASLEIAPGNRRGPTALAGVLTCGDRLGADALAEFAVQSGLHRDAELLYADEVRENPATGQREAFFKPDFSPDLLFATNYIGRPWVATPSLLARAGASPRSLRRLGEYDLLLRCAERAGPGHIHAIPRLLCEREAGTAEAPEIEMRALADAAVRRGIDAIIEPGCLSGIWRPHRRVVAQGKVSIIVPTAGAGDLVRTCLTTLRQQTAWAGLEIVAIDNIAPLGAPATDTKEWLREAADRVVDMPGGFGWSRFANRGAAAATGDFLLFLDDDTAVLEPGWLDAMMEHAQRPEIGIVGARLLYPDDKVQQAGRFLAAPDGGRLAFRFSPADDPGYFGLARTQRNVLAVSGSCMLMRRDTFDALGGFDEAFAVDHADLDFCLRAHAAGLLTIVTPHAALLHHEGASRDALADDDADLDRFTSQWHGRLALGDPYFSPNLSTRFDDFRPNDEPARAVSSQPPQFRADEFRQVLVIKADDSGDFVTALPAIRRLKEHFPEARLTVLANPATRRLAALEPAIDSFIDFAFVTTRAAHGRHETDPEALAALMAQLAPHAFDLAIDLRKHPDTRPLLRAAGATMIAGFDHLGRFPWLDVALEWEGDRRLQAKRGPIGDDLMRLVDAVATAVRDERLGIAPQEVATLQAETVIPIPLRRFLAGPVVCIQPDAADAMKQWPIGHFAALIDLLVSRDQLRVLLVGDEPEADVAAAVLRQVTPDERVMSAVGTLPPDVLPAVIAGCALFVGNDSGLKHLAAALGVPTVGVHSGVTDPVEWAPHGDSAIAVARAMTCSPCYLTRIEDCPRDFACMRGLAPATVHRLCRMLLARRVPPPPKATITRPSAVAEQPTATAEPLAPAKKPRKPSNSRREPVADEVDNA